MSPDQHVADLAESQLGCATKAQAVACGLTHNQVHQRIRAGRWEWAGSRTFTFAGAPPSWEQQVMAGCLDLGPQAVVSHRSAAALHGFDGFVREPVEFTLPRAARNRGARWSVHTTTSLPLIDRVRVGIFPCTSAARTIVDLARHAREAELERAIDTAVRNGLTSPIFLRKRLAELRGPGRHGVTVLDRLMLDSGGHTPLERAFLRMVRLAGMPTPTCQRRFTAHGRTVARVDFCFDPPRVVVEVSGQRGHSSPSERAKDARRRNELQSKGFVVLEFTYDDVVKRPRYVLAMLRDHLT